MIQKLYLPLKPKSKPRGKIGKHGNIYHQSADYSEYQRTFNEHIKSCSFSLMMSEADLHSVLIDFHLVVKRGGKNDVDNLAGSVLDALVKYGVISDDNHTIVKRLYSQATVKPDNPAILIYFVGSKREMLHTLDKYFE